MDGVHIGAVLMEFIALISLMSMDREHDQHLSSLISTLV